MDIVRFILPILLGLLLLYFLVGQVLVRRLLPQKRRLALMVRDYRRHVRKLRVVHMDLLDDDTLRGLAGLSDRLSSFEQAAAFTEEQTAAEIHHADEEVAKLLPAKLRKRGFVEEYLEIILVALAVAFGFRAVFLQPFKIPTGSMQPTLYGIHFVAIREEPLPGKAVRFLQYLHQSRRYADVTVRSDGFVRAVRPAKSMVPLLFPKTAVRIGSRDYVLPGRPVDAVKCNDKLQTFYDATRRGTAVAIPFQSGEKLARGYLVSGDHVFVNRMAFNFQDPRRGDVTVFRTEGIKLGGRPLNGNYYIKRLVGLPGDEIRIDEENKLYVRRPGEDHFSVVGESLKKNFGRIYSGEGGYHGYVHMNFPGSPCKYLLDADDTFTVPEDSYFMLGDNSRHSLDSRFWGTVPRENLVGRASLVWWPASRRWGPVDIVEPDPAVAERVRSSGRVE